MKSSPISQITAGGSGAYMPYTIWIESASKIANWWVPLGLFRGASGGIIPVLWYVLAPRCHVPLHVSASAVPVAAHAVARRFASLR